MIKVYSAPGCRRCVEVKRWLKTRNVEFQDLAALNNREEFEKRGLRELPIVEFNGEFHTGFNPLKLEELTASMGSK